MPGASNGTDLTLTIIFGCLATILAFAGVVVACVQYRPYTRTPETTASTPSTLEAGPPLTPMPQGDRVPGSDALDPAPKSNGVEDSPARSDADIKRT
jgi:hypothetical protein